MTLSVPVNAFFIDKVNHFTLSQLAGIRTLGRIGCIAQSPYVADTGDGAGEICWWRRLDFFVSHQQGHCERPGDRVGDRVNRIHNGPLSMFRGQTGCW